MGSHERGMNHTFLGSVAKSVLRRSHVPTLIVPLVPAKEAARPRARDARACTTEPPEEER